MQLLKFYNVMAVIRHRHEHLISALLIYQTEPAALRGCFKEANMDKINALISLNEAKKHIDELIVKLKHGYDESENSVDTRKLLIVALSILGALVVIGVVAYAVYKHFSNDSYDYDDLLLDDDDEEEDEDAEDEADADSADADTDGE